MMLKLVTLYLFAHCCLVSKVSTTKTLYGQNGNSLGSGKLFTINAEEYEYSGATSVTNNRRKRYLDELEPPVPSSDGILTKINHLNDTHKQLMVHWVGENSRVIICLARDAAPAIPGFSTSNPSNVYISYDDGDSYENKTEHFKTHNGSYATLEKFYNHPKYNNHFVFTDIKHNLMYVTNDYGKNFTMLQLDFTPSEVSFHEFQQSTFVVLDKNDTLHRFWITQDFGKTFHLAHEFVKSFFWINDVSSVMPSYKLIVQRFEPNNLSSILISPNLFKNLYNRIYTTNVIDVFPKGDYLFMTKYSSKNELLLYVSYKLGKEVLCIFNSPKKIKNFLVVDVTGSRALVAVSHSENSTGLYVSESLAGNDGEVKFTLSLEDVFAFFPGSTWKDTWLHHLAEDAFADIYKVEGLSGIYIASRFVSKPIGTNNLGPHNLGSVITFNHGATWRAIQPPQEDVEGQSISCLVSKNCSLHLSQKFSQLFPESRSLSILSSKSAPGIILATGVVGKSLKGHYSVYISLDAGLTWRQILRDNYFFNMGDHGGILTAVKYYRNREETRHIEYSIDEGETWNQTEFHNEELKLYGLMTEPGENTSVFTMFGSMPDYHQWIIVKVDLKAVFKRNCGESDYKMWSPSQSDENRSYIPCIMGVQTTYERRMPKGKCLNGLDFVHLVSKEYCDCDLLDYECDFDFIRVGNPPRCVLEDSLRTTHDPYKAPSTCKPGQFYNRTKGYRKISGDLCRGGFESHYLPDQVPCAIHKVDDFLLFAQRDHITRYNLVTKELDELPIQNLKNVIAIDFDLALNCLYWADIALDTINRQCFNNGSKVEVLVSTDLSSIEGMAFDWISKTLYFVDGVRSKIELIRTDINHSGRMRRTILNSTVLHKPRGIALHPQSGYMFWTDWSAENPSVNRANLDGTNTLMLFGREKVEWPNGITVDYIANRIYWVDARQDYIGSSDLHGDGFLKIVSENEFVSHPFAVAVFKNNMYWDDWKRNSIFSADKDAFRGVNVIVKQFPGLMDLKVFAHGIQIGTNACSNASCPHICVGLPKNKYACLCPDGLTIKDNKCMCPGNVEPKANLTCPAVENSCSAAHFTCGNGLCIPTGWKCDGENDCGDNSDELHCTIQTCPPTYHVCGDGKCVPHYWRCDFDKDCSDGSDEVGCPKQNCTEGQFACENGRCISAKWKCDGENDCRDGSDERNCNIEKPTHCKKDEFQCKGGSITCIPATWKCDSEPDCRDGSDELSCDTNTCLNETQFSCGPPNNRCIYKTWVCDGDRDCLDGRDELNCPTDRPYVPYAPKVPTEFSTKNSSCQEWMFKCKNNKCIPFWWKCDGVDDCGDSSDELGCPSSNQAPEIYTTSKPSTCENNQFQCLSGDCIFSSWVCDGMYDCTSGEDENNCDGFTNCTSNQFKCRMDGSCVPLSAVCDGHFDCPDTTDELSCEHNLPNGPATPSCSIGMFPCDRGSCHPLALLCDGKADCKDGYDESNCSNKTRVYQVIQMVVDERGVRDTWIFFFWWLPLRSDVTLDFMPSISKVGENKWQNQSWEDKLTHNFTNLTPFTMYNITVYVRLNHNTVFPPAKYLVASTDESFPSEPLNLSVMQQNGSHILLSWSKPKYPNGIIASYDICWTAPNSREVRMELNGNETSHLLSPDFDHNVTYTFWVIAHNRKYTSNKSQPVKLLFDGDANISLIKDIVVVNETERNITFGWKYNSDFDGFKITAHADRPFPDLAPRISKMKNITMSLAPGTNYRIDIHAFKGDIVGPSSSISIRTRGNMLPQIVNITADPREDVVNTVNIRWEKPNSLRKANWTYGVYYGISQEKLFEKPRMVTTYNNMTITNLEACEIYLFSIGLLGPYGYGPLTSILQISTAENTHAPPKRVHVGPEGDDMLKMKVQWVPSCPSAHPEYYIIRVQERTTTVTSMVRVKAAEKLFRVYNVSYGGIYDVSMSTNFDGPYTKPATYYAPPITPPLQAEVKIYQNGSYLVNWTEPHLPGVAEGLFYDILVQEGNKLNENTAQIFTVSKPPFIYSNSSSSMFTFAVRVRTARGLKSELTKSVSKYSELRIAESSVSIVAIIVPSLLILLALSAVIVFLLVRNRKLHGNFTRFANSHYDTRSEAATFEDNCLEEEENPQIRGFADDEPLVIA